MDVLLGLERSLDRQAEVFSLDVSELSKLSVDVSQMQCGDFLVEDLGEDVDADGKLLRLGESNVFLSESSILGLEQHDLSEDLVAERAGHDEGRVTGGTAQVDQTTLG